MFYFFFHIQITPLATPDVLSYNIKSLYKVRNQFSATLTAFHQAHREGFRLQEVGSAPLALRRRLKRSTSRSDSSDSSRSSISRGSLTPTKGLTMSPMRNSPVRNLSSTSSTSQTSNVSTGFTPLKSSQITAAESSAVGIFSFKESRIAALTPTMTTVCEIEEVASGSSPNRGVKRKIDLVTDSIEEDEASDDDDCIIIHEEPSPPKSNSDTVNNNHGSNKRPRSETIVIE